MFRAQQNAFDDAVAKATDENLTSENWEYILDVCDRVGAEDSGPKDAVVAMIKRLAHRNANVQLYTLELANSLSQNCGRKMHQELASRSFTDALLRLANDRNTHQQVKSKILERMAEWTEMFSKDPDLGIMEQAFTKLKTQNPNLHPPSKPTKNQMTDVDRQKEEEELQMALALSIKDKAPASSSQPGRADPGPSPSASQPRQSAPPLPTSHGTTAATVSRVRALYDFVPSEPGELQFRKGDIIAVLESVYKDWWKGSLRGQMGIFPLNYVEKLADPTQEELQREAEMEAEVFGQIKNVEKLLTLLSTSSSDLNVRDNEEITELYHSTLAIRPKLIELIGKYSQRKDDFTQLNEKFIKARRDYESLLEASMSQPAAQTYGRPNQPQYGYGGGYPGQAAPPQQGPGRYYTPGPEKLEAGQPQGQRPPQNGPQPFTYDSQGPSAPSGQPQYPPGDPHQRLGSSGSQQQMPLDPYGQHRPQSTYDNPQELSSYNSPVDNRQKPYPPNLQKIQQNPQPNDYSPSIYSANENDGHPPQSQQQPVPAQPSYAAPQPPYPSGGSGPPPQMQKPYQQFSQQQGPPGQPPPFPPQSMPLSQQGMGPGPNHARLSAASPSLGGQSDYGGDQYGGAGAGGGYHPTHHQAPPSLQPGYSGHRDIGAEAGSGVETSSNPNDFYR